jgi:hypothetical protein
VARGLSGRLAREVLGGRLDRRPFGEPQSATSHTAGSLTSRRGVSANEESASAALFLTSDDSRFASGSELFVNGGSAQI